MALDTVADYIAEARTLLLDKVAPYRYADSELVSALNLAFLEARRLRPDLFLNSTVPSYIAADSTAVAMDEQYRSAILYYIVGHAHMRDEEDASDARASTFKNKFVSQLLTVAA